MLGHDNNEWMEFQRILLQVHRKVPVLEEPFLPYINWIATEASFLPYSFSLSLPERRTLFGIPSLSHVHLPPDSVPCLNFSSRERDTFRWIPRRELLPG